MNGIIKSTIAELNDLFRKHLLTGAKALMTDGVSNFPDDDKLQIVIKVRDFTDFTEDNDPYGERDFGTIFHKGNKIFWKIDYYDLSMKYHSEDPSDKHSTVRVLTIMLASEY